MVYVQKRPKAGKVTSQAKTKKRKLMSDAHSLAGKRVPIDVDPVPTPSDDVM